jgi:hypothetical protein
MHDLAQLRRQAKTAYETGRIRLSARVALVILPLTAICAWETRAPVRSAILGGLLLACSTTLRWWRHRGIEIVRGGLGAGVVPTAAALLLCRLPFCPPHIAVGICTIAGLLSGTFAGYSMTRPAARRRWDWCAVSAIACLTAALGCLGLGLGTAVGAAIGITIGTAAIDRLRFGTA